MAVVGLTEDMTSNRKSPELNSGSVFRIRKNRIGIHEKNLQQQ